MQKARMCMALGAVSAFVPSFGVTLTPAEALARLYGSPSSGAARINCGGFRFTPENVVSVVKADSLPCAYVFSNESAGYVVLNADSRGEVLLGYGSARVDSELPPAMLWWIGQYGGEMASLPDDKAYAEDEENASDRAAIPPLCETQWGQGEPYNLLCPEIDGKRTWSGCVAISMAQIMNHFRWPETGMGSHSYTWDGRELSADFSSMRFMWDDMLPSYKSEYSSQQAQAVAQLSFACGVAVDMNYGLSGSGAEGEDQAMALMKYFDYGKSTTLLERTDFKTKEWERILYGSLEAGAPVAYMGFANGGGHAFLLDGYDGNGFFHFNWGWTGDADGYFRMSAINPYRDVYPGYLYGYNRDQKAVVYALPSVVRDSPLVVMSNRGDLSVDPDAPEGQISLVGKFTYLGNSEVSVAMGVSIADAQGNSEIIQMEESVLKPMEEITELSVALPQLPDGVYKLSPVYYDGECWRVVASFLGKSDEVVMHVDEDGVHFEQGEEGIALTLAGIKLNTPFYMGKPFEIEYEIRNDGRFEQGLVYYVAVINGIGDVAWNFNPEVVCLEPGESETVAYQETLPFFSSLGTYKVAIAYLDGDDVKFLGDPIDFNMEIPPQGFEFEGTGVSVMEAGDTSDLYTVDYGIRSIEGFYCYRLRYAVSDEMGNIVLHRQTVDRDFVLDGETSHFSRNLKISGLPAGDYLMRLYASVSAFDEDSSDDSYLPFLGEAKFSIVDSAVDGVSSDDEGIYVENGCLIAPEGSRLYNLQGVELSQSAPLSPGIYIVRAPSDSVRIMVD